MPWCEGCAKFWNPNTMGPDGSCPRCGRVIAEPAATTIHDEAAAEGRPLAGTDELDLHALAGDDARVPWHFKLMVVALVVYLAWRGLEGAEWLLHQL